MAEPILSVVIPCYNHGKYILEALNSVINNDKTNICEIIIINDGSTDKHTVDVLNAIKIKNVQIFHQENQGLAKARNRGVELAKCSYILFLDSDNKITSHFLNDFIKLINSQENFDVLHGDAIYFGEKEGVFKSAPLNLYRISINNYIDACAIIKKQTLIEIGLFDHEMPFMGMEDWDLWIRMARNNKKTIYKNQIYFHYRVLGTSMINSIGGEHFSMTKQYVYKKYNLFSLSNEFEIQLSDTIINNRINSLQTKTLCIVILKRILVKLKILSPAKTEIMKSYGSEKVTLTIS